MKPLHIIYIPGLGDHMPEGQRRAITTWRLWGVESELFQMHWADDVPWQAKFKRLLNRIDELHTAGTPVAIAGASAGATAVITAFAARKDVLVGAVCIAGKINQPETIGESYSRKNPSFVEAAFACEKALATLNKSERSRIMTRYGLFDETVLTRYSKIPGANNRRVWAVGHVVIIGLQITLFARNWIRFLKTLT